MPDPKDTPVDDPKKDTVVTEPTDTPVKDSDTEETPEEEITRLTKERDEYKERHENAEKKISSQGGDLGAARTEIARLEEAAVNTETKDDELPEDVKTELDEVGIDTKTLKTAVEHFTKPYKQQIEQLRGIVAAQAMVMEVPELGDKKFVAKVMSTLKEENTPPTTGSIKRVAQDLINEKAPTKAEIEKAAVAKYEKELKDRGIDLPDTKGHGDRGEETFDEGDEIVKVGKKRKL